MFKNWYMVQVFTGWENKVERTVQMMLDKKELDSAIVTGLKVPVEEITEIKDGKKRTRKNKLLPGYIMVKMELPELGWKTTCSAIRRIQGVNGFVGTEANVRPRPITETEAQKIICGGESLGPASDPVFEKGETVKIVAGPFKDFEGNVEEINLEKSKVRVMVQVFGRATPVEVDFSQVEKVY